MKYLLLLAGCFISFTSNAQNSDVAEITSVLKQQEAAWNEGNLEKFMIGYWQNDNLLFIGKSGPTYGYSKTLANYKKGYPDTAQMGKFTSTIIHTTKLSKQYYYVTGKWFLQRTVGNLTGYYTLLIRKIKGKWLIVADHSS